VLRVLVLVLVLLTSHALWSLQLERRMQRCVSVVATTEVAYVAHRRRGVVLIV
jgi:hypothetical protein